MHRIGSGLVLSATDLSGFLACRHLTTLDLAVANGGPKPPKFPDPSAEVLRARGLEHEARILAGFRADGLGIVEIAEGTEWQERAKATQNAMVEGADLIYQGCLFDGAWVGLPDFLRKVERRSDLGAWSYEVVDAKLAREAKAGAVLQITLYSDLLARAQGVEPERMHLALGRAGGKTEAFRYHDFAAYYRSVRARLLAAVTEAGNAATYPEPVEHCQVCAWAPVCDGRRRADDHLSLVAGAPRKQRRLLEERGVSTLAGFARLSLPLAERLDGVSDSVLLRSREQARIQLEGREAGDHRYELFRDVPEGCGLGRLPEPSPGDLFFDIESDPHVLDDGLEYLFGWCDAQLGFTGVWALNRTEERAMFEAFMDTVSARLTEYPDLHIYHFGHYEPTVLKRLAGRFGTREAELDRLLRGQVLVDLHRVVTQSLRASIESYSIKKLEPLFRFRREVDLRTANSALSHFEAWLALGEGDRATSDLLRQIEGYNRDDCVSTAKLRDWLEELRRELEGSSGSAVPRPAVPHPDPSEAQQVRLDRVADLMERLTNGVPDDPAQRTPSEQARWLLAQMLEWHRREAKSFWWQHFEWLGSTEEELLEDRSTLAGLEYLGVVRTEKKSHVHRYRFPKQEHGFGPDNTPVDPATGKGAGTVVAVDDVERIIDLKRGMASDAPYPSALIPYESFSDVPLRESLLRFAESVVEHGLEGAPERAAVALLLAELPRAGQVAGAPLRELGESTLAAGRRLALSLDRSALPVQGPPGSGKTYTGAHMVLDLLAAGKRVGVTATGHKVISHFLDEVCQQARAVGKEVGGVQLIRGSGGSSDDRIEKKADAGEVAQAITTGQVRLAAGTAWLWARPELTGSIDVLVVDEAAQMSLANALAAAPATRSIILLGDPQQLSQPLKGVHPPGADASALAHLADHALTLPPERGLFLDRTWRLHPNLCAFTSELYYEGLLEPMAGKGLERQAIGGLEAFEVPGLYTVGVEHVGNTNESKEEVEAVRRLMADLLAGGNWTNARGEVRRLGLDDILVVAPYNAQVGALLAALPTGARVGTVDKFQGQEAPVVIYSPASSSAEDAPRGMEFLYQPNRLNVATSRAKCVALLVGSTMLYSPDCRSVRQMRLANGFCRFAELAREAASE